MALIYTFLVLTIVSIVILFFRRKRAQTNNAIRINDTYDLQTISIADIDQMEDGTEFEEYLLRLLRALGYSDAYKTVGSHDFGADLVFTDSNGNRNIIQAKRYKIELSIGIDAVQQIYTARNYYQAKKATVIGTTKYTDSSDTLAGVNGVLLLDRKDLIDIITAYKIGDLIKARNIIEKEPRIIYEFWDNKDKTTEIKKDKKISL